MALVLGGIAGLIVGIEVWTLNNDIPGDHITDSFRALASADLGVLEPCWRKYWRAAQRVWGWVRA